MNQTLRGAIKSAGYNQITLATKLGVHQTLISQWINGKTNPSLETVPALASALGLSESEVLHFFIDDK